MELKPGDQAPSFAMPDENGKVVSSDSLKGKTYFLYFYPKDDTPGCTVEACQLNDNLAQFKTLGVPVLGVSRDTPTTTAPACSKSLARPLKAIASAVQPGVSSFG